MKVGAGFAIRAFLLVIPVGAFAACSGCVSANDPAQRELDSTIRSPLIQQVRCAPASRFAAIDTWITHRRWLEHNRGPMALNGFEKDERLRREVLRNVRPDTIAENIVAIILRSSDLDSPQALSDRAGLITEVLRCDADGFPSERGGELIVAMIDVVSRLNGRNNYRWLAAHVLACHGRYVCKGLPSGGSFSIPIERQRLSDDQIKVIARCISSSYVKHENLEALLMGAVLPYVYESPNVQGVILEGIRLHGNSSIARSAACAAIVRSKWGVSDAEVREFLLGEISAGNMFASLAFQETAVMGGTGDTSKLVRTIVALADSRPNDHSMKLECASFLAGVDDLEAARWVCGELRSQKVSVEFKGKVIQDIENTAAGHWYPYHKFKVSGAFILDSLERLPDSKNTDMTRAVERCIDKLEAAGFHR